MILFAPFAARPHSLNGSASPKDYPHAKELAELLKEHNLVQVGGSNDKQVVPDFRPNLSFHELGKLVSESRVGICVDSYLQHFYWYLNRRAIVLFGPSDPLIFGHASNVNLLKHRNYLRQNQFDLYYNNEVNPEAFVSPEEVLAELKKL